MVDEKRLEELLKAEAKLQALENAGVDNWQWYSEAMEEYDKWEEVWEKQKFFKLLNPLLEKYAEDIVNYITENTRVECLEKAYYSCIFEDNEAIEAMLLDFIGEVKKNDN
jgi:hypothetical protein